jgi:hypothetical protein
MLDTFVGDGSPDGTDHEDLIALTQIALGNVSPGRIEIAKALEPTVRG